LLTYSSILSLFAIAGFGVAIWSGLKILRSRETKSWQKVSANIQHQIKPDSELPEISYHYGVDGNNFHHIIDNVDTGAVMPGQTHPLLLKYPNDSTLDVYYNPQKPAIASLTKGAPMEDKIVFGIGICVMLLGIYTLI